MQSLGDWAESILLNSEMLSKQSLLGAGRGTQMGGAGLQPQVLPTPSLAEPV